jgi:hypothetical protein
LLESGDADNPYRAKSWTYNGRRRLLPDRQKIDTHIWELFRVPQPAKIVAEIEAVHIRFYWQLDLNPICKFSRLTGSKLALGFLAFCD